MFLVSPTYEGACANVAAAAQACHAAGVPLVVDEAHGAHLSFLGSEGEPEDFPRGKSRSLYIEEQARRIQRIQVLCHLFSACAYELLR